MGNAQHIKIKGFDDRVAAKAVHFGGAAERRKLEIGEVVAVEDEALLEAMLDSGKIELTNDPVTRPLDFNSVKEARYCSPNFKPRDAEQEEAADEAKKAVAERLKNKTPSEGASAATPPTNSGRQRAAAKGIKDGKNG